MVLSTRLMPRVAGGPLHVLLLGRTSARAESLVDQIDECAMFLTRAHRGPTEVRQLDTQVIRDAEAEISTGTWDLLLLEDLSRIDRDVRLVHALVQHAVRHGTRVVALRDCFDSAAARCETVNRS